jgi:acetate kinase
MTAASRDHLPGPILVLNGGSSSIKFAVFEGDPSRRLLGGVIRRLGRPGALLEVTDCRNGHTRQEPVGEAREPVWLDSLMTVLDKAEVAPLAAIGHRVVHGGTVYRNPVRITAEVVSDLRQLIPQDPEHLPRELALIEFLALRHPEIPQVACFDTAFHQDLPSVARLLPIPRRYAVAGLQRFGFHGISYAYLLKALRRIGSDQEAEGRVILAHLGHGASMAAVKGGRSIDTTMGLTPASGLPMGTRSGDLDPGLLPYLSRAEGLSIEQWDDMVNRQSGLLGLSETTSDMRDLLDRMAGDPRAAEAVDVFCYQARKCMGAYAAVLGGLDTLVFSGGIGERAAPVRKRICAGLEFLGLVLDDARNAADAGVISKAESRVTVRVIPTDEESEIAAILREALSAGRGRADG